MYYMEDLQSGIAKAVQESKCVVCFIVDGNEESQKWDDHWIEDHNLPMVLEKKAITMMFSRDSDEAEYFHAFCPITTVPFLAVVYQGQVVERLTSGISKNDFTRKLLLAVTRPGQASESQATASPSSSGQTTASSPAAAPPASPQSTASSIPQSIPPRATAINNSELDQARALAPDDRLEGQRAVSAESGNQRQEEDSASGVTQADIMKKLPQYRSYAEEQVIRKSEAKEELDRVRKQVEYDKQARRERNQYGSAAATNPHRGQGIEAKQTSSQQAPQSVSGTTRLQVRLLDGSAIRSNFEPSTLFSEVRKWLDSSRTDGHHPYSLKQLMTPAPSRPINDEDHNKSLHDLGLHPSATLVMAPLRGLAAAYQQSPSGAAQTIAGMIWTYIVAMTLCIVSIIKTFLGLGERPQQTQVGTETVGDQSQRPASSRGTASGTVLASRDSGIRIRSLKDQRRDDTDRDEDTKPSDHQLYNGGGLNFEPRRKDEEDPSSKADS